MALAMARFPFDTVAFDLDGTLADTAPDLAASLNHVLAALGRPGVPAESVRNLIGHGARALLRRGLAASGEASEEFFDSWARPGDEPIEELVERGYPLFLDFYGAHICDGTAAFDGLEEALDALAGEGVALAVCTNKNEALTSRLLAALGWERRFAAVVGGDTLAVRKPEPAPLLEAITRAGGGRAAFVGDSIVDAATAKAAGIPFVAVSFGFSDRPAAQLGADAVIDCYAELVPALRRL
jgi:phosphoglycolate phosphatase